MLQKRQNRRIELMPVEECRRLSSSVPGHRCCSRCETTQRRRLDKYGQSYTIWSEIQSVVMVDRDGDKEKVAYRSSGRTPKGIGHTSEVKSTTLTRSTFGEEAEGGPS